MLKKIASPQSLFRIVKGKQEPLSDPFAADEECPDLSDTPTIYSTAVEGGGPKTRARVTTAPRPAQRQGAEPGSASPVDDDVCYESQSPDEAALVHAARAYGFTLLERTPDRVTVRLPGRGVALLTYEVLDILTFDSTRKRMSVLVRHPHTHEIILYTKGADSAVMELLEEPADGKDRGQFIIHAASVARQKCDVRETKCVFLLVVCRACLSE